MTGMDVLNAAVGLTSLVMGGFAIWLSLYMYGKAKDSETETTRALEAIKAQSEALQRLTGRWMDRFTKHAISPRPADEGLMQLVQVVAGLPNTILATVDGARRPTSGDSAQLQQQLAASYMALYYYTALSNVLGQNVLPPEDQFDPSNEYHANLWRIVDGAAADFDTTANLINGLDHSVVASSALRHLLEETVREWQPHVRYTSQTYSEREQ